MANDGLALNPYAARHASRSLFAEIAFGLLLLLLFVGLSPFAPPPSPTTVNMAAPAPGDTLRQVLFLSTFALVLVAGIPRQGFGMLRAVPPLLVLLLGWCFLSVLWSAVPGISFRRAVLAAIVVISTLLSVDLIGSRRAFLLWRITLAVILVVNWLSIPLIETAVHLPGEIDPSLVGDWRGLYAQKNTAGAACVLTALLFLFTRNGRGNWIGWLMAALAIGFLAMTRSKTALALFPLCLAAGLAYRMSWRDGLGRAIFLCGALLAATLGTSLLIGNWEQVVRLLEDPGSFTGRVEIWQAIFAYMRDHFYLGAGFGTMAHTGAPSPLHAYARGDWVETIADSHSGYLQILAATGAIGLGLALLALVADPLRRFWRLDAAQRDFKALLFALFVFVLAHNVMETDFLESDSSAWFAFLVMLASLRAQDGSVQDDSLTLRP